jgi:hypothetical protein
MMYNLYLSKYNGAYCCFIVMIPKVVVMGSIPMIPHVPSDDKNILSVR